MIRRWTWTIAGLAVLASAPAALELPGQVPFRKNILLVVLDDVGTDKLSFYDETPGNCVGYSCAASCQHVGWTCDGQYAYTPRLNALRDSGVLFRKAYSMPWCSPTRACILTGKYPLRTGVGIITNGPAIGTPYELPNDERFVAEVLRDGFAVGVPYRRGAFGKWHLTTEHAFDGDHAAENGFNYFSGTMGNVVNHVTVGTTEYPGNHFFWNKVQHLAGTPAPMEPDVVGAPGVYASSDWQTTHTRIDAVDWINDVPLNKAFFAYVCFNAPHAPLQVPPMELLPTQTQCDLECSGLAQGMSVDSNDARRFLVYRAMLEAVDKEIGKLLDDMDDLKRANTMVIVMADNGTPPPVLDVPPHFAGHAKGTWYEGGIRVPLIVSGPLVPPSGRGSTSDTLVSATDLWATIADIANANVNVPTPVVNLESQSFLSVIEDPSSAGDRDYVFSQVFTPNHVWTTPLTDCLPNNQRTVSDGTFKLFREKIVSCPGFVEYLVDLPNDPDENDDQYGFAVNNPASPAGIALPLLQAEMNRICGEP